MFDRNKLKNYSMKQLREITGLTQRMFSYRFNIPLDSVINWENRRRKPPVYVVEMLERIISLDWAESYNSYPSKLDMARKEFLEKLKTFRDINVR